MGERRALEPATPLGSSASGDTAPTPRIVDSDALFAGASQLAILHDGAI